MSDIKLFRLVAGDRSFAEWLPMLPSHLSELVASLEGYVLSQGDDVQRKELKLYVAFKRLKNFATVVPQKNRLLLYLHLDPAQVVPLPGNGRDVGQQGQGHGRSGAGPGLAGGLGRGEAADPDGL